MNTTIGAGMVALAFTIKSAGMGLGTIIMLSLAFFSFITIQLLLRSGDKERQFTFKSLGVRAFSKNAGVIFEAVIFLQTFGVCTMYVIICGMNE
jgi:amino acid permease